MSEAGEVLATIALGANLGERAVALERALAGIEALPRTRLVARSSWHETEAVGGSPGQPRFLNGVMRIATGLGPRELLAQLQRLEREAGRVREHELRYGPRVLDLDLIFYGEVALREPGLELPHPRAEARLFVLEPLCEIAPELRLPACGKSVRERVRELHSLGAGA